ncbi:glycerophosphodiester phosphodiesterase [Oceanobacillus saliphilus]|uniref:glycerophosphodiester phosphodiesterase n=1 Tax=Oceanobacillus saliphilus TaxID=2925834 RepID=UPI00201DC549|nr:glycerophosphodiester phosphodiesterase family protein [Oceanobacillus saliphilus]
MTIRGIAHQGYSLKFPENTLSSFQAAIDLGFTHTKLDVHLSKDGVPVVMHDHTIDRMTDGYGEIKNYTVKELQNYTINHDEKIPTLEEVLRLTKNRIKVFIELKQTGFYHGLELKVFEILNQLEVLDQAYLVSFNHHSLARLRVISKKLQIGPLANELLPHEYELLKPLNISFYVVKHYRKLNKEYVNTFEKEGIPIAVWPVNTIDQMKQMQKFPKILVGTDELEKYQAIFYPETVPNWQEVGM